MVDKKQRKTGTTAQNKTSEPIRTASSIEILVENELRKWDEKYYALVENSPLGITVTQDGIRKFANKRFADMLGYSKEELIGKPAMDIIHPDDRSIVAERIRRRLSGEMISGEQSRVIDKAGNIHWFEVSGGPIVWEGKPAALNISSDVTEKKHIRDLLQESEERYRLLVENAAEGIWVIRDGTFLLVNKKATEMLGYTEEELLNKQYVSMIHPDDKKLQLRSYRARLRGEHVPPYRTRLFDKAGNIRWFELNGTAITFRGEPAALTLVTDITERIQSEERLNELQTKYYTLVEQASEGITVSQDGIRKFANRKYAEIVGYSVEELIGKPITDVIHPDDREDSLHRYQSRLKGETVPPVQVRLVDKAGNIKWIEHSGGQISWEGRPAALNVTIDITERKQLEDERLQLFDEIKEINTKLSRFNRELQDFALVVSSTLQEPLRKIKAFSELLQDSLAKTLDEDQRENFHFVIDGAGRMQSVINDLRLYSQITTKTREYSQVNMGSVIEILMHQELEAQLKETRGTIRVIEPLLTVYGDSAQIRQLMYNLLNNALKFHKDGVPPEIIVRSEQSDDGMVLVEIQDNGIGIAKEHHENIFSMLFMLHPRTRYGGSGMGLAIAKQIVNRLGGEIGVKSAPGEGSTFWFTLPYKPD